MPEGPTIESLAQRARCPRCGYDQRGAMATWQNACPLDGTCTECGLLFPWRELLNPDLSLPKWCVEARRAVLLFPVQFLGTALRCWLSPMLWKTVRMIHAPNWWRLSAWLALWCMLLVLSVMISNGVAAVAQWSIMTQKRQGLPGFTATTGAWPVFVQATITPLSSTSIGFFTPPPGVGRAFAYTSPVKLLEGYIADDLWQLALMLISVPITTGLAFAALPISRRRAKVRALHIGRGMIYAYALIIPLLAFSPLYRALTLSPSDALDILPRLLVMLADVVMLLIWLTLPAYVVFWWACAALYLRMQHAWAVALSVTIVGALAPISIAGAIWYWSV
jgi:hypothetical protein